MEKYAFIVSCAVSSPLCLILGFKTIFDFPSKIEKLLFQKYPMAHHSSYVLHATDNKKESIIKALAKIWWIMQEGSIRQEK